MIVSIGKILPLVIADVLCCQNFLICEVEKEELGVMKSKLRLVTYISLWFSVFLWLFMYLFGYFLSAASPLF